MRIQNRLFAVSMVVFLTACCVLAGCSRHHYRVRADRDGYGRVFEKASGTPWMPDCDYSVYPAPNSRLHDPSPTEDPCLPEPSPQLYAYELPALPPRDSSRFSPDDSPHDGEWQAFNTQQIATSITPPEPGAKITPSFGTQEQQKVPVSFVSFQPGESPATEELTVPPRPSPALPLNGPNQVDRVLSTDGLPPAGDESDAESLTDAEMSDDSPRSSLVPLPRSYWELIPVDCLSRMLEFETVRAEYEATYGEPPAPRLLDDSPKLALEDIVDLTMLNSRELQTQKEQLFRTALALTLERFDYQLKPSVGNNGTAANYVHDRSGRITDDTLRIPSSLQLEKLLYTGGDFIGRFANSVLLNFNGPQGFTADVSSELLFGLTQSLLQRDVRLENLTQAERNVVYAARNYARFRKVLFVQQAGDYYSLIRQFRQIEINCQNYFTLAREFNQRSVEIQYGFAARTQLDQVEQQVINGRQSILSTCTSLENSLDSLKIRMGIPTEQPLNLDLAELNLLTLRDELAVNAELIARTRTRVSRDKDAESQSAFVIVGGLVQLVEQMLDSIALREQLGEAVSDVKPLEEALLALQIEAADIDVSEDLRSLLQELNDPTSNPTKVIQRRRDVADELLKKLGWQAKLLARTADSVDTEQERTSLSNYRAQLTRIEDEFKELISGRLTSQENERAEQRLLLNAAELQDTLAAMASEYDEKIGRKSPQDEAEFEQRALDFATELIPLSESYRDTAGGGLVPVQIDMDDAMMTALVQRFDLMNQRGLLADDWRQVKYAADDLRSVLNLQASQSIRTRRDENRPFDLTFDDSTTSVGVTLDLPFNRRAQRNQYRASLFNYQSALRSVMQLEDGIKLSVRRDLRTLDLDRRQYANDVAGAALASARVTGTELEVRLGFATSRDFLESQTAYVQAVSNVASRHISYIVGRLQLFLDLESLSLGADGFWDQLYDEQFQPEAQYQLPGYEPAYGCLHPKLKYSSKIKRMRCVSNGVAMVHREDTPNLSPSTPMSEEASADSE